MIRWWTEGGREERVLEAILRVGAAGCFIGHGAFGILGKDAWLPYFAVVGIPASWAWYLMPMVGGLDIVMGALALTVPRPAIFGYMVAWATWTALLRPLAGESVFETLERAGNYGIPLAFLVAVGFTFRDASIRDWLRPVRIGRMTPMVRQRVAWVLRGSAALLLVGHGGLALSGKALLADHLAGVGVDPGLLTTVGWGEIVLGLVIAVRPAPAVLIVALLWKVGTEALYPVTGAPIWEFVERAGSYAAPLALLTMSGAPSAGTIPVAGRWRRHGTIALSAATLLGTAMLAGAMPAPPRTVQGIPAAPVQDVLDRLRSGGLVLACRHAITDRSRGDARQVDFDDPSTQRVLSDEGRAQARRLGEVFRALGIPVGEVLGSPYARAHDSGVLAFGRSERSDALAFGNREEQRQERHRLLRSRPSDGNRVLMTHQGVLYDLVDEVERGSIREGDCLVLEPLGDDGFAYLGRYGPEEFDGLEPSETGLHTSRTTPTSARAPQAVIIHGW